MAHLDFEKPIVELEDRIRELKVYGVREQGFESELRKLEERVDALSREIYDDLSVWQKVQLSRHPERPYFLDYLERVFPDFVGLHGDRLFGDDPAIVSGFASFQGRSVAVIGHQKGRTTKEKLRRNFGMAHPEGYRKAMRVMELADRFRRPVMTFIDTPGAYPGIGAEERGQSEAIGQSLLGMSRLGVPVIATVIGEGGSGGALALGVANRVLMLQFATYSVITPEGCASILSRGGRGAAARHAGERRGRARRRRRGRAGADRRIASRSGRGGAPARGRAGQTPRGALEDERRRADRGSLREVPPDGDRRAEGRQVSQPGSPSFPGYGGPGGPGVGPPRHSAPIEDPYRRRKIVGGLLWLAGQGVGAVLLFLMFVVLPVFEANPAQTLFAYAVAATLAFPAMCVYLTFPRLLDRYDPEPLYALMLCLLWGAIAACGFSALINTAVGGVAMNFFGPQIADAVSAVASAPLVEEFWKGLAILGVFYFLRNEFDGVVDGIIYATFVAIGFAATENVLYYGRSLAEDPQQLAFTFVIRGIIAPWGHPLYTSMTGIGFGLARESDSKLVRFAGPFVGYGGAVFLHALWNGSATAADAMGAPGLFLLMLPLWLIFVAAFVIMVMFLVRRRGRIIREHLTDEVALGHLSQRELDLVTSAFGGLVAWFRKGSKGTAFVRAVARLGLSKWHTARALRGQNRTYSMDFILPLRARIREIREQGGSPG